jgi:methionyl-tRNA formyltransferase
VVSRPDAPAGRGRGLTRSPVALAAGRLGLATLLEPRLGRTVRERLAILAPAVAVSADFGLWIPPWLLSLPSRGVVNVHPSLLPLHRGAAPVQRTILSGDSTAGISFMLTDSGWDTGPVISGMETDIIPGETAGELEARLSGIAASALPAVLEGFLEGLLMPVPQVGEPSTAPRIAISESVLDWHRAADCLVRMILAFNPEPCARTTFRGRALRILRAGSCDLEEEPGVLVRISASRIAVGCGGGSIELLELQPESRKAMTSAAFCAGYRPAAGERLG